MLVSYSAVVVGLVMLVWGSDRFIFGAAAAARNLGVSPLIIGLTIVGLCTSAPEALISAMAAWNGNPGISIGNAVGSNIANIGLVLGVTALVGGLVVRSQVLRREFPVMFGVLVLVWMLLEDGMLNQIDGVILMGAFGFLLTLMIGIGLKARTTDPLIHEFDEEIPTSVGTGRSLQWLVVGLVVLLLGSRAVVWGAVDIARFFQVSDLLIGLTVVAVGTSLPELAASITSVVKGEPDIAVGNVIGSNMFNLLPVLALPGLIHPGEVPDAVLQRDYPVMAALTVALLVMAFSLRAPSPIGRWKGGVLLLAFAGYQTLLYFSAS